MVVPGGGVVSVERGTPVGARRTLCARDASLSHKMYLLIICRKLTPPQNRQLIVWLLLVKSTVLWGS